MSNNDFWEQATGIFTGELPTAIDHHLSEKVAGQSFDSVRELTEVFRTTNALPLSTEAGAKVSFTGGLGAYMTYENPPPKGALGEVVNVKSANGDITHHDGKVFVQWDDGEFRSIHAEHLRLAGEGKTAKDFASMSMVELGKAVAKKFPKASFNKKQNMWDLGDGRMVMFGRHGKKTTIDVWTSDKRPKKIKMDISIGSESDAVSALKKHKAASDLKATFEKIKALAEKRPDSKFLKSLLKQMADKGFAPTDKQMAVVKKIEKEIGQMATMQKELKSLGKADKTFRVSNVGDLTEFLKVSEGKLIHKSTNDLWSMTADGDDFLIERLFDDTGEPLQG